ncbi:Arc family DNA-binding protein [Salmonella enterica subsp. enterica]|nr:hypothetical protein [Salmonella enterica subsp. enterica serovar Bareilly]EBZ1027901.1 Arc family DNA-binding protein [Salmonella enterica subsp. enterica serovar Muenchen]EEC0863904.1 Arc family DNA-binding protein [Salmonella enterica subsp. enterica serovar Mikawasima]HAK7285378.1 Arc family DNA-binding protein [Salmonella enterica]
MSRTDPQLKLRLPAGLKEVIERHAKINGRSMNAEIVSRLTFTLSGVLSDPDVVKAMQVYHNRTEEKMKELRDDPGER